MLKIIDDRIKWVDYLKAFACFLVVLGHLLQSLQKAGIDNYQSITSFIIWFIYLFHMPLFMCMSGFLYSKTKKEFSLKEYRKFEFRKIFNLIIPYITFYLLYVGINILFSNSVNDVKGIEEIIGIINNPMPPYWFLYSLMCIFIVVPLIEKICNNNNKIVFAVFFIIKIISIFWHTNIFFIDSIMVYAIYFYFGIFFKNENKKNKLIVNITLICLYVIISLCVYFIKDKINNYLYGLLSVFFAITGMYICIKIFRNIEKIIVLDTYKKYTFQIFLMHTIFAAGIRIVLLKFGINNYIIHLLLGLIFSIYFPTLVAIISDKILYTNFFFYPIKTIERIKERKKNNVRKKT